jgi:hypothetical protein
LFEIGCQGEGWVYAPSGYLNGRTQFANDRCCLLGIQMVLVLWKRKKEEELLIEVFSSIERPADRH